MSLGSLLQVPCKSNVIVCNIREHAQSKLGHHEFFPIFFHDLRYTETYVHIYNRTRMIVRRDDTTHILLSIFFFDPLVS